MSDDSSDSEEEHLLWRMRKHPLAESSNSMERPLSTILRQCRITCQFCNETKSKCTCTNCAICTVSIAGKDLTHCRNCHIPCCRDCRSRSRFVHLSDRIPRTMCNTCALRSGIAVLEVYPALCSLVEVVEGEPNSFGLLWGVYALKLSGDLPNRCVMPHSDLTYFSSCVNCGAPTVPLAPHAPRRVFNLMAMPQSTVRVIRELYFTPFQPVSVEEANAVMRKAFPRCEDFFAFHETIRPWEILLAAVAAGVAYEYAREPQASLRLSDIPYASLLSLLVPGSRFSMFEGPEKTKYIAVPGTHNSRTALVNLKFDQMEREAAFCSSADPEEPATVRNVESDDDVEQRGTNTWRYRVHLGFAKEADEVYLPIAHLLHSIQQGYSIVFCGHSLGGSVAMLLALKLLEQHKRCSREESAAPPIRCITFGAPLVGNTGLWEYVKACGWISCFHHVVQRGDSVPSLLANRHVSLVAAVSRTVLGPAVPLLSGAESLLRNIRVFQGAEDWSTASSFSRQLDELSNTVRGTASQATDYCCVGRFHFLSWGELKYTSSNDCSTCMSILKTNSNFSLDRHSVQGYNQAIMRHVYRTEL